MQRWSSLHCLSVPFSLASGKVTFSKPLAGLHQLNDVDKLLQSHDWGGDSGDNPRPEAVNLVCPGKLQSSGAPGATESRRRIGVLSLKKRRRENRRREGEQIKTNEEKFIEGTAYKKYGLQALSVTRSLIS
jgi:hypothetical protein